MHDVSQTGDVQLNLAMTVSGGKQILHFQFLVRSGVKCNITLGSHGIPVSMVQFPLVCTNKTDCSIAHQQVLVSATSLALAVVILHD